MTEFEFDYDLQWKSNANIERRIAAIMTALQHPLLQGWHEFEVTDTYALFWLLSIYLLVFRMKSLFESARKAQQEQRYKDRAIAEQSENFDLDSYLKGIGKQIIWSRETRQSRNNRMRKCVLRIPPPPPLFF